MIVFISNGKADLTRTFSKRRSNDYEVNKKNVYLSN